MGTKTRDGIKISKLLKLARAVGVDNRKGTNHPYVMVYEGMRPCPLASSTDARKMVVPWMQEVTGYDSGRIYGAMRRGKW